MYSGQMPFGQSVMNEEQIFNAAVSFKSNRKAMNRNWSNQKANPALKTKAGNK